MEKGEGSKPRWCLNEGEVDNKVLKFNENVEKKLFSLFIKVGGWSLGSDYVVGEFLRGSQRVRLENCSSVLDTAPIIFYVTAPYDPILKLETLNSV